ncbi:hypothetical protein PG985_000415 [Apiospora marii]|uniref:Uncharacterized protein n=1 Tax=Apiospora marii TaxID=335849 RepID=A0ABR1R1Z4_9PEZI
MALQAAGSTPDCPADGILKVSVPGWDTLATMAAVHDHLITCCDTIEHLDLRVYLDGCSVWPDRWNFPFALTGGNSSISSEEQERGDSFSPSYYYPTLKSLKLEGYRFNQNEWADLQPKDKDYIWWVQSGRFRRWLKLWWSISRERRHLTNLELWLEAMDWGALEHLEFGEGVSTYFVDVGARHLTSRLKDLAVGAGGRGSRDPAARLFTTALPREVRLERLAWADPRWDPAALGPILDRHGASLRRLELWSHEPWYPGEAEAEAALNASQVQRIAEGAPSLEHLSLKVYRSGDDDNWPWEVFEAVASVPRLASADVWLDLAADCMRGVPAYGPGGLLWPERKRCKAGEEYRRPFLNLTSASDIFRFMREKKAGPVVLERATFWVGDWERPWDGPIYDGSWIEGRNARVDCSILRSDGSRAETMEEDLCKFIDNPVDAWAFDEDELEDGLPQIIATSTDEDQEQMAL